MNEVTKIHLGRQAFNISAAAHKTLRDYIDAITKQVGDKDVVEEVELRMAELLAERGVKGEKVVLVKDVDYLKKQLGDPRDFKEVEDGITASSAGASESKRLFRDADNEIIAGVAAGLASYFGLDVWLIRILFVVGTLAWGGGALLYIVLWLLVPAARTSSEKLQMQGKPVTVGSLKEVVERTDVKGAAHRVNNSIAGPINDIFNFIVKLIGVGFILAGLGAIFALVAGETYLLLHNNNFLQDNIFPVGLREHLLLDVTLIVAALIAIFLVLFGTAMFRRKWPIRTWITGMLVGLILIGLATGGALAADVYPNVRDRYNANVHTTIRNVKPFTTVNSTGPGVEINFATANTYYVSLNYYGHPNLGSVKTNVNNGTLLIDSSQFDWNRNCQTICIPPTYRMVVTVYSPNLPPKPVNVLPDSFPIYQQ